jgi:FixJ family two-component response regulator
VRAVSDLTEPRLLACDLPPPAPWTLERPSVFVVDDDPFLRVFLSGVLRAAGYGVHVFDGPEALLERVSPRDRGCLVLDLRMPGMTGLELQQALLERGVALPVIFVSGQADVPVAVTAMKRGALDFLSKPVDPEELCAAVEGALRKDAEQSSHRVAVEGARARWTALSAREQEVCRLYAGGMLNKQIAAELGTTESTAQLQRCRALAKLSVGSVRELLQLMALAGAEG